MATQHWWKEMNHNDEDEEYFRKHLQATSLFETNIFHILCWRVLCSSLSSTFWTWRASLTSCRANCLSTKFLLYFLSTVNQTTTQDRLWNNFTKSYKINSVCSFQNEKNQTCWHHLQNKYYLTFFRKAIIHSSSWSRFANAESSCTNHWRQTARNVTKNIHLKWGWKYYVFYDVWQYIILDIY